jgi:hypothetical protein
MHDRTLPRVFVAGRAAHVEAIDRAADELAAAGYAVTTATPTDGADADELLTAVEVHLAAVAAVGLRRPGPATRRRRRRSDTSPTTYEPSLNHQGTSTRVRAGETSPRSKTAAYGRNSPRHLTGAALPAPRAGQCSRGHRGQSATACAVCRSEMLGGTA